MNLFLLQTSLLNHLIVYAVPIAIILYGILTYRRYFKVEKRGWIVTIKRYTFEVGVERGNHARKLALADRINGVFYIVIGTILLGILILLEAYP